MSKLVTNNHLLNDDHSDDDEEDDEDYSPNKEDKDQESNSSDDDDDNDDDEELNEQSTDQTAKATEVTIDKNKLDKLWNEFCSDKPSTVEKSADLVHDESLESNSKTTKTKEYDFAGEIVLVKEETKVADNSAKESTANKRRKAGLSDLLTQLKKPKMSTLKKSLCDWNEYKETNEFEEELEQHRRSKGSYLQQQAFLTRTDFREFEKEKSIRDRQRKLRDLKQQQQK